jgi:hypothetical protein
MAVFGGNLADWPFSLSCNCKWAPTNKIVANGFTKELTLIKHSDFIKQLNIVDVEHIVKGGLSIAL